MSCSAMAFGQMWPRLSGSPSWPRIDSICSSRSLTSRPQLASQSTQVMYAVRSTGSVALSFMGSVLPTVLR